MKKDKRKKSYISLLDETVSYTIVDRTVRTILSDRTLLIRNMKTKKVYMAASIDTPMNVAFNSFFISKWKAIINCYCEDGILWPVDIVLLNDLKPVCYLVYEVIPVDGFVPLSVLPSNTRAYGFESGTARFIALCLVKAWMHVERYHILYFGLDDDMIFVNENDRRIYLLLHELVSPDDRKTICFTEDDYFSEVVDPYYYHNAERSSDGSAIYPYDRKSQYFAFVSMIFRLMIGIYPFEGPGLSGYDYNAQSADNLSWINYYLQNPVFVFSSMNKSNSIEMFNKNEIHRRRWNSIGDELRKMFSDLFEDAMRNEDSTNYYSAECWYRALQQAFDADLEGELSADPA